jgi:radical SAM peptide maturase (CXXX-repeat target family)/CXXX repeat peptide maturase
MKISRELTLNQNDSIAVDLRKMDVPKQEISFTVTEKCNLNCSYCYLPKKNSDNEMTFEVAKRALDYFLNNSDFFSAPQVLLNFIGGEPLLNISLMDEITDYFKIETYKRNHRWFGNYKLSFTTNGTEIHNPQAIKYIEKNRMCLYPAISLDGVEEKHNNARKYKNGRGSYNDVLKNSIKLLELLPYTTVKATFGAGDLKFFKESVLHFLDIGFPIHNIHANVAYEDIFSEGDDLEFEKQLKDLADHLIENNICTSQNCGNIFSKSIGLPYTVEHLTKNWCNAGYGIIVGTDGTFYPCIRFQEMAFKDPQRARKMGNIDEGINFDILRPFRVLTLKNCSPKRCLECSIASGCQMCTGHAVSESKGATIFSRPTYICKMHKARVNANEYFWKKIEEKEKKVIERNSYLRKLKTPNRKILHVLLSNNSVSTCSYSAEITNEEKQFIPIQILQKSLELLQDGTVLFNFICPSGGLPEEYEKLVSKLKFQITKKYENENAEFHLEDGIIFVLEIGELIAPNFSCANSILHLNKEKISSLSEYILHLFSRKITRINLIIDDLPTWKKSSFDLYRNELEKICEICLLSFMKGQPKSLNILTDRIFLSEMNNCNAGIEHITLGPDGKFYLCPAFYYKGQSLAFSHNEIREDFKALLKIDSSPICRSCDAFHCKRCYSDNLEATSEINIPGQKQCTISHIEREFSRLLQKKLYEHKLLNELNSKQIPKLDYLDPFKVTKNW